jgi:hypothetical protein
MEKRAGSRVPVNESACATLLNGAPEPFPVRIVNMSGTGMRILLERPLPQGALVKVDWEDTLLLGEVCYCEAVETGYAAGLELEHALLQTGELARLSRRLLCQEELAPARNQPA